MSMLFDLHSCLNSLSKKRLIFHSEADFQFALAWEIQLAYPDADVRLEYCPKEMPEMHVDIVVFRNGHAIPIELKYKTASLRLDMNDEAFRLKNHGAQDVGKYDCLLDLQRIETMAAAIPNFSNGYVVWLTNDESYRKAPRNPNPYYRAFSIHEGSVKSGRMEWDANTGAGTTKGRKEPIVLRGTYPIKWVLYSRVDAKKNGAFHYALTEVCP